MGPLVGILLMLADGFFMGWLDHLVYAWWTIPAFATAIVIFVFGLLLLAGG